MKTLIAVIMLVIALVGCGGGADSSVAGSGGGTSPASPAAAASTLMPTVWLADGTPTTSCALEPLCSGVLPVAGKRNDYRITRNLDLFILTDASGNSQVLSPFIHALRFQDAMVSLQTNDIAAQAYRLYQAAFNRKPDLPGLGFWIDLMSHGMSLLDVANAFYHSPEFISIYGANPSNAAFVNALYRNALQRPAEPAGFNYWVGLLDGRVLTPAAVLVQFSESLENQARVLNDIQFGITYIPPSMIPPPPGTFLAKVSIARPEGWPISGVVHLEVKGSAMSNVELLPATGYAPRYGVFAVSPDGTVASLDFDTRFLPNGPIALRISAFSRPPGDPAAIEIIAMPTRTWTIQNTPDPAPAVFQASLANAPQDGAILSGVVRMEVRGNAMENVELLPASGYTPRLGVFQVSPDKTYAWLDFNTANLPDGLLTARISAFNVPGGAPNAIESVVMPARTWQLRNGTGGTGPGIGFSAVVTAAPQDNAPVRGIVRLEVRGTGMENVELLPAGSYAPRLGVFNISADKTYAWMDFNAAALPSGPIDVRISAFNRPAGQPGATEIVAMPSRRWLLNQ
ncbi:DUF4214 domain-containing protein [Noviherbaspirillum galbum]|uniref:DUF4214 domain-containing protein n=1 Tax=Noviherbaspirillum galbum TaxID=2709383 RepID=A0A6B3SZT7_9BURK|nr:DUF4214 domain-containing protein [Noviherbaspirillum galbum]NEX64599.1 DUF4214 domain-containing protein [Noviherbaspirillum galbum]